MTDRRAKSFSQRRKASAKPQSSAGFASLCAFARNVFCPVVLLLATAARPVAAQEKPLDLSGTVNAGYSASHDKTDVPADAPPDGTGNAGRFREIDLGLDLHAGTFIL